MQPLGLTGVTLVALDDAWSAMRFRPAGRVAKRESAAAKPAKPFKLKDHSFKGGHGLQPGIRQGDWEQIRDIIYGLE